MSDKQLTVAELLARAEKENPEARKRPRRRRSLDEGGVTVAELTDSFKKVDVKPDEVKHSAHPLDAPEETPEPAAEVASALAPAPAPVSRKIELPKPEPVEEPVAEDAPSTSETTVIPKVTETAPARPAEPETGEIPVVEEPEVAVEPEDDFDPFAEDFRAEPEAADVPAELDEPAPDVREIEVEEASINPIVMVLLVFVGVLIGVLGFLAFQWLWANTSTIVAALLALVAVAAVVFGVRAMRTGRDGLTMTLAGLAAAVMAFGPALI